jgi:hypothetical protein
MIGERWVANSVQSVGDLAEALDGLRGTMIIPGTVGVPVQIRTRSLPKQVRSVWNSPAQACVTSVLSNPVLPPHSFTVTSRHFYQSATKDGRKPYPGFTHYSQSNGNIFAPTSNLFFLITNLEIIRNKSRNNSSHVSFVSFPRLFSRGGENKGDVRWF